MHELTKIINSTQKNPYDYSWEETADKVIRAYLEEKAKKLQSIPCYCSTDRREKMINEILGLTDEPETDEPERESYCSEHSVKGIGPCPYPHKTKEDSMKWCEHSYISNDGNYIFKGNGIFVGPVKNNDANFCPICKTPRPKAKSLAEKFAEHTPSRGTSWPDWESLVKLAEEHFKEHSK